MNVRCHVAETGQIDLVRFIHSPQYRFHGKNYTHQLLLLGRREVGHFTRMAVEDDATESWIIRFGDTHDTAKRIFPDKLTTG